MLVFLFFSFLKTKNLHEIAFNFSQGDCVVNNQEHSVTERQTEIC